MKVFVEDCVDEFVRRFRADALGHADPYARASVPHKTEQLPHQHHPRMPPATPRQLGAQGRRLHLAEAQRDTQHPVQLRFVQHSSEVHHRVLGRCDAKPVDVHRTPRPASAVQSAPRWCAASRVCPCREMHVFVWCHIEAEPLRRSQMREPDEMPPRPQAHGATSHRPGIIRPEHADNAGTHARPLAAPESPRDGASIEAGSPCLLVRDDAVLPLRHRQQRPVFHVHNPQKSLAADAAKRGDLSAPRAKSDLRTAGSRSRGQRASRTSPATAPFGSFKRPRSRRLAVHSRACCTTSVPSLRRSTPTASRLRPPPASTG